MTCLQRVARRGLLERGISEHRCGIAIVLPHGTNPLAVILLDSPWLARVRERGLRCHRVRTPRCHVRSYFPEYADGRLGSAQGLAVSARVPTGDPVFPAVRKHDGHARRRRVIPRIGGSRNVTRRYNEWTYLEGPYLP